ncbi:MAG TPA: SCP2 sterol-binding domain-containing protein [Rhodocyclaceae bacterium]|nr:SCP2 sterol-binding domain-containing protein [Rhodocyclaceae bacterium]
MRILNAQSKQAQIIRLPSWLAHVGPYLPQRPWSEALVFALEAARQTRILLADLSFLDDKVIQINIEDLGVLASVRYCSGRFRAMPSDSMADILLSASACDYLKLLRREEDPDTLFFQRRLRIEGDTELGLILKNFLDSSELPRWLQRLIGTI